MGFKFGSFNSICETAALVICPLVGTDQGIEPKCYSRNVDVAGKLLFQPCTLPLISIFSFEFILLAATCFVHIVAIIMTAIMILHIRSKYTAVGRKEIVMFFWMYAVIELLAMFLDSGVIPSGNATYPVCIFLLECHSQIYIVYIIVVCGDIYRPCCCNVLLFAH